MASDAEALQNTIIRPLGGDTGQYFKTGYNQFHFLIPCCVISVVHKAP